MNKFIYCFAFLLLLACTKEEVTPRSYPRVETLDVTDIASKRVQLHGEITFTSVDVVEYGFVWTTSGFPSLENGTTISLGNRKDAGTFDSFLETKENNTTYSIRAFARSEKTLVYGNLVEFISAR